MRNLTLIFTFLLGSFQSYAYESTQCSTSDAILSFSTSSDSYGVTWKRIKFVNPNNQKSKLYDLKANEDLSVVLSRLINIDTKDKINDEKLHFLAEMTMINSSDEAESDDIWKTLRSWYYDSNKNSIKAIVYCETETGELINK